jgi:hypothetical protein
MFCDDPQKAPDPPDDDDQPDDDDEITVDPTDNAKVAA